MGLVLCTTIWQSVNIKCQLSQQQTRHAPWRIGRLNTMAAGGAVRSLQRLLRRAVNVVRLLALTGRRGRGRRGSAAAGGGGRRARCARSMRSMHRCRGGRRLCRRARAAPLAPRALRAPCRFSNPCLVPTTEQGTLLEPWARPTQLAAGRRGTAAGPRRARPAFPRAREQHEAAAIPIMAAAGRGAGPGRRYGPRDAPWPWDGPCAAVMLCR